MNAPGSHSRAGSPRIGLLLLMLLSGLLTLSSTAGSAAAQGSGRTFVLTNLSDPDPIDPALTSHTMSRTFERNVYESLVYYKLGTTELEPVLAEKWDVSPDGMTYTFTLRQNVKFQNGADFTADDVKATFDRDLVLKEGVGGSYLRDVSGVNVVDPLTVSIGLTRPYVFFLGQLPKIGMVSAADVKAHNDNGDLAQGWFKDNANGTGPYTLKNYVRGQQYTLVRNPQYWRSFPDNSFDTIIVRPIADSSTQAQLIQRGEVNMGSWMSFRDMIQAAGAPNVKLYDFPSPMTLIGALNGGRAPLNNVKVRQAVLAAFPYDRMAEFYQGHAQIPTHVLSASYPGSDQSYAPMAQDLDKARQLLADAGYPGGGGLKLRYVAVQGLEDERQAGLLLQDALQQIGIELQIDVLPFATFFDQAQQVDTAPDISPGYEAPETDDPFQWFAKLFKTDGFLNFSHFGVPELDSTIEQAQVTKDDATRIQLLQRAQRLIYDNGFAIPISNFNALYVGSSNIGNFQHDLTDLLYDPKFFGVTSQQ